MKRAVGECPDPESIAAYLDNRIDGRERARITEHLASCNQCYEMFTESAHVLASPGPWRTTLRDRVRASLEPLREWLAAPRVRWASVGAALATAAALWLVVGSDRLMPGRRPSAELQALVAAVGTERTVEGRLTGGFAYGPLRGPVRSGEAATVSVSPDVRIAVPPARTFSAARSCVAEN